MPASPTPLRGLPRIATGDDPDVVRDMNALAVALDDAPHHRSGTAAARRAFDTDTLAVPTYWFDTDFTHLWVWNGLQWWCLTSYIAFQQSYDPIVSTAANPLISTSVYHTTRPILAILTVEATSSGFPMVMLKANGVTVCSLQIGSTMLYRHSTSGVIQLGEGNVAWTVETDGAGNFGPGHVDMQLVEV